MTRQRKGDKRAVAFRKLDAGILPWDQWKQDYERERERKRWRALNGRESPEQRAWEWMRDVTEQMRLARLEKPAEPEADDPVEVDVQAVEYDRLIEVDGQSWRITGRLTPGRFGLSA